MEKKKTAKNVIEKEKPVKEISFEKALKELEDIALKLESGEMGLEESINRFERGLELAHLCRNKLDEAERKIEILQKGKDGSVEKRQVRVKAESGELDEEDDLQGSLL